LANFPAALDSLANPGPLTLRNDPGFELHSVISTLNDIAEALEAKLGIGASTPGASAAVLRRTAGGASAWGLLQNGDITDNSISGGNGGPGVSKILPGSIIASDFTAGTGFRKLADTTLGSGVTLVDFPNISQAYASLQLIGITVNASATSNVYVRYSFDGTTFDAGANYDYTYISQSGATLTGLTTSQDNGLIVGATGQVMYTPWIAEFPGYSMANVNHAMFARLLHAAALGPPGVYNQLYAAGVHRTSIQAIRGLRVYVSSGTLSAGARIMLFGLPGPTG
jgi:hypothetical protein